MLVCHEPEFAYGSYPPVKQVPVPHVSLLYSSVTWTFSFLMCSALVKVASFISFIPHFSARHVATLRNIQPRETIKHGGNLILFVWFRCFMETRNVHICLQGTAIHLPIGRSHINTVPVKPQILNLLHSQQR